MLVPAAGVTLALIAAILFAPTIVRAALWTFYGLAAFVSLGNLLVMARPRPRTDGPAIRFLIPARNEAANLAELLPQLTPQGTVTVFDDESDDGTAEIAARLGAEVLRPDGPLPRGWTGKNRACHALGTADWPEPYLCFLDADVRVTPDVAARRRAMARPKPSAEGPAIRFLIPARNEAENLAALLPVLKEQGSVTVFDDESEDATAEIARAHGATVLRPAEPLPEGWTGKNRACHALGHSEFEEPYLCFLDADVRVTPDFAARLRTVAKPDRVATAFPTIVRGLFPEPIVLAWVGWSLLALNPFFLVQLTGKGHNRFTNGQITLWPKELYRRLNPNERTRGRILEDVLIGRLLANEKIPVLTLNLASSMSTAMYRTWDQAYDGMSKNSYEITGNGWGNAALAGLLALLGFGPFLLAAPPFGMATGSGAQAVESYALLTVSALATARLCRGNLLYAGLFPLSLLMGALILLRSHAWRLLGKTRWKGRVYG